MILINSVLNPLTSSLSPSEKSKGDRFNSVKIIIIKTKTKNKKNKLKQKFNFKFLLIFIKTKNIKNNIISKEILWLQKRIEPIKEYFDLLNKPINIIKNTEKLIKNIKIIKFNILFKK